MHLGRVVVGRAKAGVVRRRWLLQMPGYLGESSWAPCTSQALLLPYVGFMLLVAQASTSAMSPTKSIKEKHATVSPCVCNMSSVRGRETLTSKAAPRSM